MRIWFDDKRSMPSGYDVHMVNAYEVIRVIQSGIVTKISLDHDVGSEDTFGNGYMIAKAVEEAAFFGTIPRIEWYIHSQNSVGVASMRVALERANLFWDEHKA